MKPFKLSLVAVLGFAALAVAADAESQLLVVCSPGSPGTTEEAQPTMDAFAAGLSAAAGRTITAVYEPTDAGGVARLAKSGLAIVSLPFFLEHEKELGLHARLEAVQEGRPAHERWTLVAQKGRVANAHALAGFTIISSTTYDPAFVRGLAALPADVKLAQTASIVSALRRAAAGEAVAVWLDGPQQAALASLPFAAKLDVVAQSPPLPAGLVVTVDAREPKKSWSSLEAALLGLGSSPAGTSTLSAIHMARFAPLDEQALAAARKLYRSAP